MLPAQTCSNIRGLPVAKRVRVDHREVCFNANSAKPQNHDILVRIYEPCHLADLADRFQNTSIEIGLPLAFALFPADHQHPSCIGTARCTRPLRRDKPSASFTRSYPTDNLALHKTGLPSVRYLHGTRAATFSQFGTDPESPTHISPPQSLTGESRRQQTLVSRKLTA